MKKLIFLLLAIPFFSLAQDKNVVSTSRVFPKGDKIQQFEKALAAHSKKFHTGTWKWRVFSIESGPESGGYHITEGPMSWDDLDTRGDLGKVHQADWDVNISPLLLDKGSSSYSVFRPDLSTVALTEYSNKIAIIHNYPKPGYTEEMEDAIKKLKKTWEIGASTVAVYEAAASGPQQYTIVIRYKQGLKERNVGFRAPMKERFNNANGDGAWDAYTKSIRTILDHSWSELLFYHPELSSN